MKFRDREPENLEISLTPMIDVVFLLLIFFMLTTTFDREKELQLQLPRAEGQNPVEQNILEISVDISENYFIDRKKVFGSDVAALKDAIRLAVRNRNNPTLVIVADAGATHQAVVRILDAARQLELVRISFATENPRNSSP
jgi:biopolymer transport protein ExbD